MNVARACADFLANCRVAKNLSAHSLRAYGSGDLLQMTGDAEVILDSPEIAAFQGAERLWTFRPRRILRRAGALALRWSFRKDGWSPASLMTGNWEQAAGLATEDR